MALNGTPAADTLSARFDGDEIYGLGGRDVLTSSGYVGTLLDGGVGNDQLTTYYETAALPGVNEASMRFSLFGGLGNDKLTFWVYAGAYNGFYTDIYTYVTLWGDDGADELSLNWIGAHGLFQYFEVYGGNGDDIINVSDSGEPREELSIARHYIDAGEGNDRITIRTSAVVFEVENRVQGGGGNDTIIAEAISNEWEGSIDGTAHNEVFGGGGNDLIRATAHTTVDQDYGIWGSNVISGDAGDDTIDANSWGENQLSGGIGNDVITGTVEKDNYGTGDVNNVLDGGDGDDHLFANAHLVTWVAEWADDFLITNRLTGGTGNDTLQATAYVDDFDRVGSAVNILLAGAGNDSLVATIQAGTIGANRMFGHEGSDRLQSVGGTGNLLNGGPGADVLIAGDGTDTMMGGTGNDIFRFLTTSASTPTARDVLQSEGGVPVFDRPGAQPGDQIDVSAIDANVAGGVQHFVFGTSHAVGRLWAVDSGNLTLIRGNTGGDAAPEFELAIQDGSVRASAYTGADFLV